MAQLQNTPQDVELIPQVKDLEQVLTYASIFAFADRIELAYANAIYLKQPFVTKQQL